MNFLTKTEIDQLTYAECQQQLKALTTEYNLNQPLTECFEQVWPNLDSIVDMLLNLEDRIARFEDPRIPSMPMTA